MKALTITALARKHGLSRSTLLYYDRIGLLSPGSRSAAGYRLYTRADQQRLEHICQLRAVGLPVNDIIAALKNPQNRLSRLLEKRLNSMAGQIESINAQRRLLCCMLQTSTGPGQHSPMTKEKWVEMFRAAGMDDEGMKRWHAEFESRSPEEHQQFLESLNISREEIQQIRAWAAKVQTHAPRRTTQDASCL